MWSNIGTRIVIRDLHVPTLLGLPPTFAASQLHATPRFERRQSRRFSFGRQTVAMCSGTIET